MKSPKQNEMKSNEQCSEESGNLRKSKRIVKQKTENAQERRRTREMKKEKSRKGRKNELQKMRAQQLRRSQQINQKLLEYFSSQVQEYFKSCQQSIECSMKYCLQEEKEDIRNILKHAPNSIWTDLPRNDKDNASYLTLLHLIASDSEGIILQKGDQMAFLPNKDGHDPKIHPCTNLQHRLLQKRKIFFPSLNGLIDSYKVKRQKENSVGLDWAEKELILLGRVYFQHKDLLNQEIKSLRSRIEQESVRSNEVESSIDSYLNFLMAKNLKETFRETPSVDFLNYFNTLEEVEDDTFGPPITNPNDFKQFLYKRKPLKGKRRNHNLHSSCSVCLSSHYELFNPFWSCRCGLRAHKYCLSQEEMCGRCQYLKMRAEFRHNRPECKICKGKGLMLEKITVNDYAHSFCLLLHGYKQFSEGVFKTDKKAAGDQMEKRQHQQWSFKECKICCENSPQEYLIGCVCCDQKAHPLCAYLQGSRMEYIIGTGAKHNCCIPIELRSSLSKERKFKINYCNEVYKAQGL